MNRKVTTIPATKAVRSGATPAPTTAKRRVAGYARVSTGNEDQATSYEAQVSYYTAYITGRPDWELVKIYTDEGISGTSTKKRAGFQEMIRDAMAGKIDLIITKSVSRFARNTVDSLTHVRSLKEAGVEIFFEKENIWTLDAKGELLITIMSSLAQEEARSISENVTWGHRKRFAEGKAIIPYSSILGYKQGPNKTLIIDEEQAPIVRRIYQLFLEGYSMQRICHTLEAEGHRTVRGNTNWNIGTIRSILTNEKYKGDLLIQKTFTADFLTKTVKPNDGEVPQYYVEGNHEAIIDPETWMQVQYELSTRYKDRRSKTSLFSSRLICADCGSWYGRKVWHSGSKYSTEVWRCNRKYDGEHKCTTATLRSDHIETLFVTAVKQLADNLRSLDEALPEAITHVLDTTADREQLEQVRGELALVAGQMEELLAINARTADGRDTFMQTFTQLETEHAELEEREAELAARIHDMEQRRVSVLGEFKQLHASGATIEFSPKLWTSLMEHATVSASEVTFQFKDGQEVTIDI